MVKIKYAFGATPIDPDELDELIPLHITTQKQLNEWEAQNILKAEEWLYSKTHRKIFTIDFIKLLHKKMFEDTWKWAGTFRTSGKTIGVDAYKISSELTNLLNDVVYQIEHHSYSIDEIAFRFHHRLVWIHPFSNGNGRHARTMTDFILFNEDQPKFTWGRENLINESAVRKEYINALKQADQNDYSQLAAFVRSGQ